MEEVNDLLGHVDDSSSLTSFDCISSFSFDLLFTLESHFVRIGFANCSRDADSMMAGERD